MLYNNNNIPAAAEYMRLFDEKQHPSTNNCGCSSWKLLSKMHENVYYAWKENGKSIYTPWRLWPYKNDDIAHSYGSPCLFQLKTGPEALTSSLAWEARQLTYRKINLIMCVRTTNTKCGTQQLIWYMHTKLSKCPSLMVVFKGRGSEEKKEMSRRKWCLLPMHSSFGSLPNTCILF